jgi:hypothetical protein
MLAPLGFSLLIMLIACTLVLLICWAYDSRKASLEAGRSRPTDLNFLFDSISRLEAEKSHGIRSFGRLDLRAGGRDPFVDRGAPTSTGHYGPDLSSPFPGQVGSVGRAGMGGRLRLYGEDGPFQRPRA